MRNVANALSSINSLIAKQTKRYKNQNIAQIKKTRHKSSITKFSFFSFHHPSPRHKSHGQKLYYASNVYASAIQSRELFMLVQWLHYSPRSPA